MPHIAPEVLRRYLLGGGLSARGCLHGNTPLRRTLAAAVAYRPRQLNGTRSLHTQSQSNEIDTPIPFRKQLKDEAKRRKADGTKVSRSAKSGAEYNKDWELTVGIEIHAQLNTARKLFSSAASTINDDPNTHVALFDLAIPGSQPIFQKETVIPALRAALALNCNIQKTSRFDRKHYFHWDQPAGYQITQYYEPFAKDGHIILYPHDGIGPDDGKEVRIGIKQIQMEQDTAKTIAQPDETQLLDFNRVGLPLIEIITLPQIHSPSTAAAFVRKVQILLDSVDACVLGMESGGLRADVNVSVKRRPDAKASFYPPGNADQSYSGVTGLGQRTEIKNLSSFKAVRDAIIAERDRQIYVLEDGGRILSETRGWTIGSTETKRLRLKEGEVDYRYMPDPDIAPIIIGDDLLQYLKQNAGVVPDEEFSTLTSIYGLTSKDALSLVALDNGGRAEYFYDVVEELRVLDPERTLNELGRMCGNWVLHELGGLGGESSKELNLLQVTPEGGCIIPAQKLAQIINYLDTRAITRQTAKGLLASVLEGETRMLPRQVKDLIEEGGLWFKPMSTEEYEELAHNILDEEVVEQILKGQTGKIMFLVGQMMRNGEGGRVEPKKAEDVIKGIIAQRKK
jgi:aspartyl-tRNA(Asn)/glutamyl-tRNA(Gln) amidotransferase subunit B